MNASIMNLVTAVFYIKKREKIFKFTVSSHSAFTDSKQWQNFKKQALRNIVPKFLKHKKDNF